MIIVPLENRVKEFASLLGDLRDRDRPAIASGMALLARDGVTRHLVTRVLANDGRRGEWLQSWFYVGEIVANNLAIHFTPDIGSLSADDQAELGHVARRAGLTFVLEGMRELHACATRAHRIGDWKALAAETSHLEAAIDLLAPQGIYGRMCSLTLLPECELSRQQVVAIMCDALLGGYRNEQAKSCQSHSTAARPVDKLSLSDALFAQSSSMVAFDQRCRPESVHLHTFGRKIAGLFFLQAVREMQARMEALKQG